MPDLHKFLLTIRMGNELEQRNTDLSRVCFDSDRFFFVFDGQIESSEQEILLFTLSAGLIQDTIQFLVATHFIQ